MKAVELRSKTIKELRDQAIALRKENFNTRFQVASGQLEGLKKVRSNKKDIARIKTIITEKENNK